MKTVNPVIPMSVQISVPVAEKLQFLMEKMKHTKRQAIESAITEAYEASQRGEILDLPLTSAAREPESAPEVD